MLLKIAVRNALGYWKQSLAAILSVSTAYICFVLFQGYVADVKIFTLDLYQKREMYGDLIVENKNINNSDSQSDQWKYLITSNEQQKINSILKKYEDEIENRVNFLIFKGLVTNGQASKIFIGRAYDIEAGRKMRSNWEWDALYGVPLHLAKESKGVLIGQFFGSQIGCVPTEKLNSIVQTEGGYTAADRPFTCNNFDLQASVTTETGNLNASDFRVVGLIDGGYKELDSRLVSMPLELGQKLLHTDKISFLSIKLNDTVGVSSWVKKINSDFSESHLDVVANRWQEHKFGSVFTKTMSLLGLFRAFISIIVISISVISIMNTMFKIVNERTREIGSILSLGFKRFQIMKIFLMESAVLTIMGCFFGAIISEILKTLINHSSISNKAGVLSEPIYLHIRIGFLLYLVTTIGLILISLATTFFSCRATINKKIVDCLGDL